MGQRESHPQAVRAGARKVGPWSSSIYTLPTLHRIPRESGKEGLTFCLSVFGDQSNGSVDKLKTNLTDNINIGEFWATFCFHI